MTPTDWLADQVNECEVLGVHAVLWDGIALCCATALSLEKLLKTRENGALTKTQSGPRLGRSGTGLLGSTPTQQEHRP